MTTIDMTSAFIKVRIVTLYQQSDGLNGFSGQRKRIQGRPRNFPQRFAFSLFECLSALSPLGYSFVPSYFKASSHFMRAYANLDNARSDRSEGIKKSTRVRSIVVGCARSLRKKHKCYCIRDVSAQLAIKIFFSQFTIILLYDNDICHVQPHTKEAWFSLRDIFQVKALRSRYLNKHTHIRMYSENIKDS